MNKAKYYPVMRAYELYRLVTKGKTHPKLRPIPVDSVRSDSLEDKWYPFDPLTRSMLEYQEKWIKEFKKLFYDNSN